MRVRRRERVADENIVVWPTRAPAREEVQNLVKGAAFRERTEVPRGTRITAPVELHGVFVLEIQGEREKAAGSRRSTIVQPEGAVVDGHDTGNGVSPHHVGNEKKTLRRRLRRRRARRDAEPGRDAAKARVFGSRRCWPRPDLQY